MTEPSALGAYRIVGKLGDGAMGLVYEGRHDVLGRRVAIKVLRAELAQDPSIAQRFMNEARAANAISHENIVNIYDVGEGPDGIPYLVMELLEGETLADLEKRARLTPRQTLEIFVPVLRALAAAHGRGVIHRDLKPANVFLAIRAAGAPAVKLLDFGVAKLSAEFQEKMTKTGTLIGTPMYMSPEQLMGKSADPRSDLWAVGVMMLEGLTGEHPFRGGNMGELAAKIIHSEPAPSGVSEALDGVIARAMGKTPDKRYASAAAMMEALEAAVPTEGKPAPRVVKKSRAPLWAAAGLIAAGAGAAGAVVALRREKPKPAPVAVPELTPKAQADLEATAAKIWDEDLRAALLSKDLGEAGDAVAALELAATAKTARYLYLALQGPPELRRQAAHILEALKVPEAAPRVRAALDASGDRLRVELAAVLAALGDKEATNILRKGLEEPGTRLNAAVGLVAAGEGDSGRAVLDEIFNGSPRGRGEWSRAAAALAQLGDGKARAALVEELAQPDAGRAIAAAAILARGGADEGRDFLRRVVADKDYSRRGAAALALARLGDRAALAYVETGLASGDAEERRLAAAVVAHLGGAGRRSTLEIRLRDETDRRTRLTTTAALLALVEGT